MAGKTDNRQSGDADANRAIRHGRAVEVRKKIAAEINRSQALAQDIADLCQKASRISQTLPLPNKEEEPKDEPNDKTRT